MTVFITQRPVPRKDSNWLPDISSAAQYGKIEYVFEANLPLYTSPDKSLKEAQRILQNFDPEQDYLLWPNSGDPSSMWTCIMAITVLGFHRINFLYWNRKLVDGQRNGGFYAPVSYNLVNHID